MIRHLMPPTLLVFVILVGLTFFAPPSSAEIPQVISYQGKVTDTGGNPVADGVYTMRFRLYNASTGGTLRWDSGNRSVAVNDGVFNVLLGESPQPALGLSFDEDLWLLVTFAGTDQSPRQRIASAGYAYMASGLVPGTSVSGTLSGTFQTAINGTNLATTGTNFGLSGITYSTAGAGIFGYAMATTGINYGIYGQTDSSAGYGIFCYNSSGWAGGFDGDVDIDGRLELAEFDAHGTVGTGALEIGNSLRIDGNEIITNFDETLYLQHDNNGDLKVDYGTFFVDASSNEVGIGTDNPETKLHVRSSGAGETAIKGESTAATGISYGGFFTVASSATTAKAVYGSASSTTGATYGGYFESFSSLGTGVRGRAAASTGATNGVYGNSVSPSGIGVYGKATASSGTATGVWGESYATDGAGVIGLGNAGSGNNVGVYGATASPDGNGVYGFATATEGICAGTVGVGQSDEGYGVYYIGGISGIGKMRSFIPAADGHVALGVHTTAGDWVEYFGEGVLRNGRADVQLDGLFLETVTINENHPMKVFVQLHDEMCQGIAVKKSQSAFSVVELNGGRSSGTFDYRVVARRKGYEDASLELVQGVPTEPRTRPFRTRSE
jgi:hypothetical protein